MTSLSSSPLSNSRTQPTSKTSGSQGCPETSAQDASKTTWQSRGSSLLPRNPTGKTHTLERGGAFCARTEGEGEDEEGERNEDAADSRSLSPLFVSPAPSSAPFPLLPWLCVRSRLFPSLGRFVDLVKGDPGVDGPDGRGWQSREHEQDGSGLVRFLASYSRRQLSFPSLRTKLQRTMPGLLLHLVLTALFKSRWNSSMPSLYSCCKSSAPVWGKRELSSSQYAYPLMMHSGRRSDTDRFCPEPVITTTMLRMMMIIMMMMMMRPQVSCSHGSPF